MSTELCTESVEKPPSDMWKTAPQPASEGPAVPCAARGGGKFILRKTRRTSRAGGLWKSPLGPGGRLCVCRGWRECLWGAQGRGVQTWKSTRQGRFPEGMSVLNVRPMKRPRGIVGKYASPSKSASMRVSQIRSAKGIAWR